MSERDRERYLREIAVIAAFMRSSLEPVGHKTAPFSRFAAMSLLRAQVTARRIGATIVRTRH